MTSDAKIGLLLGLVFIFVIAFIINGLPTLKPPTNKPEVTTTMVPVTNVGIAGRTSGAQDEPDWSTVVEPETAVETTPPIDIAPQVESSPSVARGRQPEAAQSQVAADLDVRSIRSIPSYEVLVNHFVESIQRAPAAMVSLDVPGPAPQSAAGQERRPATEGAGPASDSRSAVAATRTSETRETARPASPLNRVVGKMYVVQDGDNLSTIAKKVYGPEEGNRLVNSDRIFEANRDTLKSKDEVRVGQTLIIPPLPTAGPTTPRPANVLPRELFESRDLSARVEALRKPTQPAPAAPPVETWQGRWYVVQEGDSLWKIASSQLGTGSRYEELRKLNADLLSNGDALSLGMKLRLPPN